KSMGLLSVSAAVLSPKSLYSNNETTTQEKLKEKDNSKNDAIQKVSILQTTDVHCQIHPHDELFWENDNAVFRKTGGYANVTAMLKKIRTDNPNTFTIDTGDMFQGSELSVETMGQAFVPVLNAMDYDL